MSSDEKKPNPIALSREIITFRKEHHQYGSNYAVRVRLGHADIMDSTAVANILTALYELGYEIVKRGV